MRKYRYTPLLVVLALVLAVLTYAFAASITVNDSIAAAGRGDVPNLTASAIHYNLDTVNPRNLTSVTFTLNQAIPAGNTVKISLIDNPTVAADWFVCANTAGNDWSCPAAFAVVNITELHIVAAQ